MKRSRISLAAENGGSVVSDEDSFGGDSNENEPAVQSAQGDGEGNSQAETAREEDLIQLMQKSGEFEEWQRDQGFQVADHGIIEEIYCQNFMCHEKLRITLGPLINFIIGHNGSGKSAVLTALTLGLGGKAITTNRGANIKSFIKQGQDSSMISVKIKNQGELAYQHDLYGDSITVERHFNRVGSSQFKVKSAMGRIITTKKADLEDMLDYLGLQLNNPLNVLSQDNARQFLNNSTPSDKYKFFLMGTQLEQLDRDYNLMYNTLDSTNSQWHRKQELVEVLKQRMTAAGAKKRQMDEAGTIRDKIERLGWQHAWAQVDEQIRKADEITEKITNQESSLDRKREDAETKSQDYQSKNAAAEAAKQVKDDLVAEKQAAEAKYDTVKEEFDVGRSQLIENQAQLRNIKQDLTQAKKDVEKQKKAIRDEERRIESATGPAQARKLTELNEAREDAEEKQRELNNLDRQPLDRTKAEADKAVDAARQALEPFQKAASAAEAQLASLQQSKGDLMKAYNPNMPTLLKAIERETKFKQKPVGPVGMHVKLKKPEWSSVVETTFGMVLEAFVVTNTHDQAILRGLQKRCSCPGDIYIGDSRPIDVSQNSPGADQDTLLGILDVEHDLIRNQFIINQSAEQTVLIRDRRSAHNFMFSTPKPRNVKTVLCMHDTIRNEGHRFAYTLQGKERMDRVRPWTKNARMKTDVDAQINNQKEVVNDAKRRLQAQQQTVRQQQEQAMKATSALKRFGTQQRELKTAWQQADERVQDLQAELDRFSLDASVLTAHQEALKEAESAEQLAANSYTDALEAKERINETQREVKSRLDAATTENKDAEMKLEKIKTAITKKDSQRMTALQAKNAIYDEIEGMERALTDFKTEKEKQDERVRDFTVQAAAIHERVPLERGMTASKIDELIDRLEKEQQEAERIIGGTREEITAAYYNARKTYKEAQTEMKVLKHLTDMLRESHSGRSHRWTLFRRHIMARAKMMFTIFLGERGFTGHLMSDHENRQLDIRVEPDATQRGEGARQTKTLSGGEKSFSQICLLLAIWEAMGSPIRCLDEFDVFMDPVNRDRSMGMMIQAARRAVGKQYILITPQAMGNVSVGPEVKIIK